jgi:hypothetical protein
MPLMKSKVKDAKGLSYDHPKIVAIRKKIQELEDKKVPYDDPRIKKMESDIRTLEGNAKDSELKPIPVDDQVLGHGAVGDRKSRRAKDDLMSQREEERLNKSRHAAGTAGVEAYGIEWKNGKQTQWRKVFKSTEAMNKWLEQGDREVSGTRSSNEAYDGLEPIPVDDDTKYAVPPKKSGWSGNSVALKTPEAVAEAYKPNTEEGFKKSFGKDREHTQDEERAFEMGEADAKRGLPNPNPDWPQQIKTAYREGYKTSKRSAKDSDESDYQEAERKLAAAKKAKASPGQIGILAAKRDDAWRKLAKDSLKPIPVNDFTPRGGLKCVKCGQSVSQTNRAVSGRALCGRCKAISEAAKTAQSAKKLGIKLYDMACPKCAGVGERTAGNTCVACHGTGKIKVTVPDSEAYDGLEPIPVDDQVLGHGAAGDRELRPIPVNDAEVTTKYAERPKPAKWGGTSMALKTPSEVKEAYAPRGEEGFKKTFGKDADPRRQSYATPSGTAKVDEKLPPSDSLHSYEALTKLARRLKLQPGDVGSQLMPDGKYHAYAKAHGMDAELEPIPVGDDAEVSTKYAEKPKAPKPFSSHVFKSEEEARKAYGAKDPEGFKRSFGKDAAGRIITPDLARTGGVGSWKPSGTYRGKTCEYDYSVAGHVLGNVMMPAGSRKDYSGTLHTSWPGEQRKFANEQSAKSWVEHEVKNYITANDSLKPIPIKDSFNGLVGKLERDGKSKAYATKIAGKVTAEKSGAKDAEEFRDPDSNIWSPFGDPNVPASLLNTYQKLFDEYYAINGRARQAPGSPTAKAAAEAAYKKSRAAFEACRAASRKARKTAPANDCCYFVMS